MEALLILLVLAYMLVLVQNDQGKVVRLLSLVGINRRMTRSESTFVLMLGGLVVLALFLAIAGFGIVTVLLVGLSRRAAPQ